MSSNWGIDGWMKSFTGLNTRVLSCGTNPNNLPKEKIWELLFKGLK